MLLADLAATSVAVARHLVAHGQDRAAGRLPARSAAAGPGEVAVAVRYLAGELLQRRTGVGWASLRDLPRPRPTSPR